MQEMSWLFSEVILAKQLATFYWNYCFEEMQDEGQKREICLVVQHKG